MKRIAIIGGLGYLGLHLVEYLKPSGHHITVFARKNIQVLADENESLSIAEFGQIDRFEKFDVVINLAYPSSYSRKRNFKSNEEIVTVIKKLSRADTTIIHTSTLAVFGIPLDHKIESVDIPNRRDMPYIEVKLHMENLLKKQLRRYNLHIIRLGNVWGPGAATWLRFMADKLVFNLPIPDKAVEAPSNITYILNVCDFLQYLINKDHPDNRTHFHHFAEFAEITWGRVLERIGEFLDERPVYKPFQLVYFKSFSHEFNTLFSGIKPSALFYKMLEMRTFSSYAKTLVDIIPARHRNAWKKFETNKVVSKDTADIVLSNTVLFDHKLDGETWQPKFNFEEALHQVRSYLKDTGYLVSEK
jgi:nucleoside-diphosphate-sugar epimerase